MEVQKMKHVCKFCKKSFPCGRSLGGHIRSHLPKPGYELRENPKKTRRVTDNHEDVLLNSTTLSSSSTETENPKSSKVIQNQGKRPNFARNNSHSSVSEVAEAEHQQEEVVAMCLIMLSQDVGSWGKISSSFTANATATESSENNSLHRGKNSKCRRRRRDKVQGNVSVSIAANGKKLESAACGYLQKGLKLKGIEVSANGFCSKDKNNKSFESKRKREKVQGKESDFSAPDHAAKSAKVKSVSSGYVKDGAKIKEFEVSENGFVSDDQNKQTPESKRKVIGQSTASGDVKKWSNLEEYEVSENGFSSYDQKNNNNDDPELDSGLFNNMSKTNCYKRSKFECTTCNKVFHSYQALGGHRASHKKLVGGGKCSPTTFPKLEPETNIDTDDAAQSTDAQQQQELVANNMVIGSPSSSKKVVQKHECPICFRVFSSGQALGGHKRSHLLVASNNNAEINGRNSEVKINSQNSRIVDVAERLSSTETRDLLDLNFPPAPAAQDETATTVSSSNSLVGFMKPHWCVESSHKHERLLGLISN